MIICIFGCWLTLTYTVENTFIQNIYHHIGVMMSVLGSFSAFAMQQNYKIIDGDNICCNH